jgi:hypothetical protein
MSYIYDKLRDALGGKIFRSGIVFKNWSPNEIRAIYIMRDFILVADYLKQPKIIKLDVNEVSMDLSNPSRRGNLNNLLDSRHLSCMEEIYVDSCYQGHRDVIDLNSYVQGLYNQASRLRYYGYVSGFSVDALQTFYSSALINGSFDLTIAKALNNFSYNDLSNKDWYKKYNLRPQWYEIDKEKGRLHTYFVKCEKLIGEQETAKDAKISELTNINNIVEMFNVDRKRAEDIKLLMSFITFCKDKDDFSSSVAECLQHSMITKLKPIKGLTKDLFLKAMRLGKIQMGGIEKYLFDLYQKVGVFSEDEEDNVKIEVETDGIYQLGYRLNTGLSDALIKNRRKEYYILFLLTSSRVEFLPEGTFVDLLEKKSLLNGSKCSSDNIDGLIKYVYSLCGFSKDDYKKYIVA